MLCPKSGSVRSCRHGRLYKTLRTVKWMHPLIGHSDRSRGEFLGVHAKLAVPVSGDVDTATEPDT